jgi:hypothetical protein
MAVAAGMVVHAGLLRQAAQRSIVREIGIVSHGSRESVVIIQMGSDHGLFSLVDSDRCTG